MIPKELERKLVAGIREDAGALRLVVSNTFLEARNEAPILRHCKSDSDVSLSSSSRSGVAEGRVSGHSSGAEGPPEYHGSQSGPDWEEAAPDDVGAPEGERRQWSTGDGSNGKSNASNSSNRSSASENGAAGDNGAEPPQQTQQQQGGRSPASLTPEELAKVMEQVRLDEDGEPTSLGSALHKDACKPCLFVHSKVGCFHGVLCRFCHFKHDRGTKPRPCKGKRNRYKNLIGRMELQFETQVEGEGGAPP